jgi:hypothetical protein
MTEFSREDLSDIETFAGGLALNLFTFADVALCRVGQDRVGVPPAHPQRPAMLNAVKARALALGYTGPALPTRDPDDALVRQNILATAMAGIPRDPGWADKLTYIEGHAAALDLDAPDLDAQLARLKASHQPPATAPTAAPAVPGFVPARGSPSGAAASCLGGSHDWGAPSDLTGFRTCRRCGLTNVIDSRS